MREGGRGRGRVVCEYWR